AGDLENARAAQLRWNGLPEGGEIGLTFRLGVNRFVLGGAPPVVVNQLRRGQAPFSARARGALYRARRGRGARRARGARTSRPRRCPGSRRSRRRRSS